MFTKKLMAIGEEMANQDNRMTQYPLFIVMEDVERAVPDGCGESRRKDPDTWDSSMSPCDKCQALEEKGEPLPDYCDECDPDMFWSCEISHEPNLMGGVFFTARACQKHIDENSYHYNNPQVYGIGAWRNPEMVEVMQHLIRDAASRIVPDHYI